MTVDNASSYRRQVDGWRDELVEIGKCLDDLNYIESFERAVDKVKDLRCRVRQVCRELNIYYDDGDPISVLIRKIQDKTND